MCESNRLRILWIDDCEGEEPEHSLPAHLQTHFEIVRSRSLTGYSTVSNPTDYAELFSAFRSHDDKTIFPVEIVAMDYNLSKARSTVSIPPREESDQEAVAKAVIAKRRQAPTASSSAAERAVPRRSESFEGLVIGTFYAAMTSDYPTGVVPMTNYGDLLEHVPEVLALHKLSAGVLNIDYSHFSLSGSERCWEKILEKGVQSLRERIKLLAKTSKSVPTFGSILDMANGMGSELVIDTPYGRRCWSIDGLFVDTPDKEKRRKAATDWAEKLQWEMTTGQQGGDDETHKAKYAATLEDWSLGRKLASRLWKDSHNENLMRQRWLVSQVRRDNDSAPPTTLTTQEQQAIDTFGAIKTSKGKPQWESACKSVHCIDINRNDYTPCQRRWALLLTIVRLLHRRWGRLTTYRNNFEATSEIHERIAEAFVDKEEVYMALFPLPTTPMALPWHTGLSRTAWLKMLNVGDGTIKVEEILVGNGVTEGERLMMTSYANELCGSDSWKDSDERQMGQILTARPATGGTT